MKPIGQTVSSSSEHAALARVLKEARKVLLLSPIPRGIADLLPCGAVSISANWTEISDGGNSPSAGSFDLVIASGQEPGRLESPEAIPAAKRFLSDGGLLIVVLRAMDAGPYPGPGSSDNIGSRLLCTVRGLADSGLAPRPDLWMRLASSSEPAGYVSGPGSADSAVATAADAAEGPAAGDLLSKGTEAPCSGNLGAETLFILAGAMQGQAKDCLDYASTAKMLVASGMGGAEIVEAALTLADDGIRGMRDRLAAKDVEIARAQLEASNLRVSLLQKDQYLSKITSTLGWRLLSQYGPIKYKYVQPAIKRLKRALGKGASRPDTRTDYRRWAALCESYRYRPERAAREIEAFRKRPVISVLMPVYNTPIALLEQAVTSVLNQYYPEWELCLADDASTDERVREVLNRYIAADRRIKAAFCAESGGISAASNAALSLATGEFVAFLDHDDLLTPDALYEVAAVLQETDVDLIYSDEDKLEADGSRCGGFAKPAWSPDLLLSTMYTCHLSVYRRALVEQAGGLRSEYDGSQDYDLALRITDKPRKVAHIPKILYHWRKTQGSAASSYQSKPYAYDAAGRALNDTLGRRGIDGEIIPGSTFGYFRVKRKVASPGKVSILIPTRDRVDLLSRCIQSIVGRSDYPDYEIIIIDNDSKDPRTLDYLNGCGHRILREPGQFNFSRLNNAAAEAASGDYLLLLNNDTEVLSGEWLHAMAEHSGRPEVGAVGAKLLYPNRRIQHAGVVLGVGGVAVDSHRGCLDDPDETYFNFPDATRNYSAVTGACLMTRRALYRDLGGLDEQHVRASFNDIDYCLRLRGKGYLITYTPYAVLLHHESASRTTVVDAAEDHFMHSRWAAVLARDPYYSPNLTNNKSDFSLDFSKPEGFVRVFSLESAEESIPLEGDSAIGQYFWPGSGPVCGIGVRVSARGRSPGTSPGRMLRLKVSEEHDSADYLAAADCNLEGVDGARECLFAFDPIRLTTGRRLFFTIAQISPAGGPPVLVWKSSGTNHIAGPIYERGRAGSGTLCFSVYEEERYRLIDSGIAP